MRRLLVAPLFLVLSLSAYAVELCDASCKLVIDFPDGGSLYATEPLTITFGDDGLINTGGGIIAYVEGDTLPLGEGQRIDFGVGGIFDIGDGGNISYTNMEISTSGTMELAALGEPHAINVETLKITGLETLSLIMKVLNFGFLDVQAVSVMIDAPFDEDGDPENSPCAITPGADATISSGSDSLVVSTTESCNWMSELLATSGDLADIPLPTPVVPAGSAQSRDGGSSKGSISFLHLLGLMPLFRLLYFRRCQS